MYVTSLNKVTFFAIGLCLALFGLSVAAVPVGPKLPEEKPSEASWPTFKPLAIPKLDFAVVVLDPQLDENDNKMRERGVWPEIRKTESMYFAYRIREAIARLNQFDRVTVAPSTSVSADLYLRGKIQASTSEFVKIRWNLIDARGAEWIRWKSSDHLVALGWHQRFYKPGKDAFQPLWNEIALDVYNALKPLAKNHAEVTRKNRTRIKRGRSPQLSKLEEVAKTRDLVLARFFSPTLYGDTIQVNSDDQWEIKYLPDTTTEDWLRIQTFAQKDQEVLDLFDTQYKTLFNTANPHYEKWLNELYPYARQMRIEKRRYKIERTLGGIVLIASAIAATEDKDNAAAVGGAVGSSLIVKSLFDRAEFKKNLNLFDEISQNYHDTFEPINVEIEGETVMLQGKADAQFSRWRTIVQELYNREQADAYAIRELDD